MGRFGRVVFRDPQSLLDGRPIESQQLGGRRGAGHRSPGAVGLIDRALMVMPAAAEAVRDLVADDCGCQHGVSAQPKRLAQCQRRWKDLCALMAAGIDAAVVAIQGIGRTGVGKCRSGSSCAGVVQQDGRVIARPRDRSIGGSDPADRRQGAANDGRDDVDQAHPGLVPDRIGQVGPTRALNELGCELVAVHGGLCPSIAARRRDVASDRLV